MKTTDALQPGRVAFQRRAWADAYAELSGAARGTTLALDDLERLAIAAYLVGKDAESNDLWARTYHDALAAGDPARAARCAFWLGFGLLMSGEKARGGAWVARASRLIDEEGLDCVEAGYVRIPAALGSLGAGDHAGAHALFRQTGELGRRFGEPNLVAMSCLGQGQALIGLGKIQAGATLLDEAMVAMDAGELSPLVAGIVYCGVIETCQQIFDLRRAQEWTAALTRWCESQPDLVPYRGRCLVHRAELMLLHGSWPDAQQEAEKACHRLCDRPGEAGTGYAFYLCGELHRLRGEWREAERAYAQASRWGHAQQPGLALLRLAQGKVDAAEAAIRRILDEASGESSRAAILPAYTEIMLAVEDMPAAQAGADELAEMAERLDAPFLRALAAGARGAIRLAEGAPRAALGPLREACRFWEDLEVPYELARSRGLIGRACERLGDVDSARMEFDTARWYLRELGALPELSRLPAHACGDTARHGLTPRELQVLRLITSGKTNKAIALELCVSERTIDRHVGNILAKLNVPSRTAATAYACQHQLL
ncbi:helix-turn-helix transcriptional regulator [Halomonas ramblicola]|uniref:helix-turn-helix transcriptional regulator n=1 Tax=Halomonas ramblicola TaxID=747349 RepID=UPI0025B38817|nr:helix-turn-helix transcriptional regulator [Halomonas ramblicola]MDN3522592.1 response regulator transcription factor [Halomonas ramblicola]